MFGPPGPPSPIYHSLPHPLPVGFSTLWWWKYRKYYFFTASDTFRHSKLSPSRNFSFQFVSASKHTNILRNLFIILVIKTFAYLELCKMRNFVLPKVSRKFRVQFSCSGTFPLCPPFLLYRGKSFSVLCQTLKENNGISRGAKRLYLGSFQLKDALKYS